MGPDELGNTDTNRIVMDLNDLHNSREYIVLTNPWNYSTSITETISNCNDIVQINILEVVRRMSKQDKQELLKLLLEAFDKPEEENSISVKQVNRLKEILKRCKKTTS